MSRVLLLCFIHGFKGTEDTFHEFPQDLERQVSKQLPDHSVQSVVYPKYETKGELAQATESFVEWLKERVIDCRKKNLDNPWPPKDRSVGVVLVAHSMGGFVAADSLFLTLRDRTSEEDPIFPLIQGILTFDTPYNGLARSMFVYGAFSNYQKVSSVFNAMTALSAAAPASLGMSRLTGNRAAAPAAASAASTAAGSSTAWQLIAVKTGTVGAIAAGGVAAYMHREAIMKGVKNLRGLNRDSVVEGYNQSVGALGQGLAYINRGNVGESFAWLSDHFTFVGSLLKQRELSQRLERLAGIKGVGVHDFYCSLGANGYWSGGYFVPERTFCAIPEEDHPAGSMFERRVMKEVTDEIQAHMNLFRPQKHRGYEAMTDRAAELVKEWFLSEEPVVDTAPQEDAEPEDKGVDEAIDKVEKAEEAAANGQEDASGLPDESPLDIAAASQLVPQPGTEENVADANPENVDTEAKRTYMQHLFQVAGQAGSGVRSWWPTKVPDMPTMPNMPNMPKVPSAVSSLGQSVGSVQMPSINLWGKRDATAAGLTADKGAEVPAEEAAQVQTEKPADVPANDAGVDVSNEKAAEASANKAAEVPTESAVGTNPTADEGVEQTSHPMEGVVPAPAA